MKKIILKNFSEKTKKLHRKFKEQAGSEEIAKPVTIEVLTKMCATMRPKRVLEIGGGIGTISRLLLEESGAFIDIYEDDDFCIKKLNENLSDYTGRYHIINSYRKLPPSQEYDIMIIDGADKQTKEGAGSKTIWLFIHYLTSVSAVYIEGDRHMQRLLARKALSKNYTYTVYEYGDIEYEGDNMRGGSNIVCTKSSSKIKKFLNFIYWELRIGWAIKNFLKYNLKKSKTNTG